MLFNILLKNQIIFLYIKIIFLFQIRLTSSQEPINGIGYKFIDINNTVIYIKNNENNIYKFEPSDPKQILINIESLNNKEIIKIDEESFAIFGVDSSNYLNYITYKIENGLITESIPRKSSNINLNSNIKYNVACSSKTICILYFINNGFHICKINLENSGSNLHLVNPSNLQIPTFNYNNIVCDSLDGDTFFCIFVYKSSNNNNWIHLYGFGNFNEIKDSNIASLCSNCYSETVVKDIINNRYLVCYEVYHQSTYILSIKCQYFSINNGLILIEDEYQVISNLMIEGIIEKPLILKIYRNSAIIEVEFKSNNELTCRLFICSLDFKISIMKKIETHSILAILNDDDYYYSIYEDNVSSKTIIKKLTFVKCYNNEIDKYLYFSNNENKEIRFAEGHEDESMLFSLDKGVKLQKGDIFINSLKNNYYSLGDRKPFTFLNIEQTNALDNYYIYVTLDQSSGTDDTLLYHDKISLICKITLKLCYENCKSCNLNKPSTSEKQFCEKCIDNFYGIASEISSNKEGYNCYNEIDNYYLKDGKFYPCDISCRTCKNEKSCTSCQNKYFFKTDKNGQIPDSDICYNSLPSAYYFDTNDWTYKPCYDTCLTCSGSGTEQLNSCITCKSEFTKFFFDSNQCTKKISDCKDDTPYWILENNNIKCISKDDCKDKSLVIEGPNKGQCVDDCQNYFHPFQNDLISHLYTFQCVKQKYCLSYDTCREQKLQINYNNNKCLTNIICEGEIDISKDDPFSDIAFIPITLPSDKAISPEEKKDEINKRIKIIKMFSEEDKSYTEVIKDFNDFLLYDYNDVLKNELSNYGPDTKIFLITNTKYMNFTITIYPLDIEDFVYEQIFTTNNLGFVNFTKMYENFINYEASTGNLLLVCIMEYYSNNSAINDLNYFIYSLEESSYTGNIISFKSDFLEKFHSQLEISYSLSNYYNENSTINQRNKEYLVDNIKEMNLKYPEIDLSNISDPFYNTLCFLFTSDVKTDMSLNDRREEYYINVSLCENNCEIITILNKDLKNPRSLCNCDIKNNIIFNSQPGMGDNTPLTSSINAKAVTCISAVFNKNSISSNIIFWIFIIVILFLIIMIVAWILYGNKELKKILGLYEESNDISDIKITISSNEDNEKSILSKNKSNEKNENSEKNKKKKELAKSMGLPDKKGKKYSNNEIESQQIEYLSAPINKSNPPKKKQIKKTPTIATKDDYNGDLISNTDPSFFKNSILRPNEKNDDMSDISFDNIPSENKVYIDNLLKQRNMLENNYIKNPVEYEKMQRMQIMLHSLYSLDDLEPIKHCNSCDDLLFPKNYNKIDINQKKSKNGKNKLILKLLDGEDLFDDGKSRNNKSDKNAHDKFQKNKELNQNLNTSLFNEEKNFEGDEGFLFPEGIIGKDAGNFLIEDDNNINNNFKQKGNKKNKKQKLNKNENDKNNENENEDENVDDKISNKKGDIKSKKLKKNSRKNDTRSRLLKSIGRNDFDDDDNEEKKDGKEENRNEQLRTEYVQDAKNRIKSELKKIANGDEDTDSQAGIFGNQRLYRKNALVSNDSDSNNLIRSNNSNILKIKSKNSKTKDNNKYNKRDKAKDNNNDNKKDNSKDNDNDNNKDNNNKDSSKGNKKYNKKDPSKDNKKYNKNYSTKQNNKHNKNDSSKEINSNRGMLNFQEEGENFGDMGVPISDIDVLKKKNSKENEDDISDINNNDRNSKDDNKSDLDIFNQKILASSISAFLETEGKEPILIEEKFFLFYWRYFVRRELCLVSFRDKKKTIPYFIRWSCFVFCLIFIFLLNCFFFFESSLHKRYLNALEGKKNSIGYYFKKEFIYSFYVALISIVFKMIIIKLVLFRVFKIKKEAKKLMRASAEKGLSQNELEELQKKRNKFLRIYLLKIIIYFILMMALSIFFAYICICYGGVFPNSISAFLYGFLFSFILSFIICAFFCLIIVSIYRIGKACKNRCILSIYIVLSTMY